MSRYKTLIAVLALTPLVAACTGPAWNDTVNVAPLKTMETQVGTVLADTDGMTLYTYSKDPTGASECFNRCARKWPPVTATIAPPTGSALSVIDRKDGTRQYAWRGKPLYRWVKDKQPGQATGHNLGEVWFAARP